MAWAESRPSLWLLAVALTIRLGWALVQPGQIDRKNLPDQAEYLEIGQNVLAGRGFVQRDDRFGQDVHAFRMPGYPVFIAACGGNIRSVRVAQAVIDTSTVLAAYLLARRWLGRRPALLAGALMAVNPFLVYFCGLLLSETLFTAILAWGAVLLVWRGKSAWLAGAAVMAAAVYVRPSAVVLAPVLALAACWQGRSENAERRTSAFCLVHSAFAALLVLISLLPWAVRNRIVLGQWVWLATNGGITRYDGFNETNRTGGSDQRFVFAPDLAELRRPDLGEVQRDKDFARRADQWIASTWHDRPAWLLELTARKIARTWSPVPLSEEYGGRTLYVIAAAAFAVPLDLLVLGGLIFGRLPRSAKAFLLLPAVYFTLVHAMSVGSLRYRVPVEPLLAVVAASVWGKAEWRRQNAEQQP